MSIIEADTSISISKSKVSFLFVVPLRTPIVYASTTLDRATASSFFPKPAKPPINSLETSFQEEPFLLNKPLFIFVRSSFAFVFLVTLMNHNMHIL